MGKKIHDLDVDDYLYRSVSVDDLILDDELTMVSSDLAYWNTRYSEALEKHLMAKFDLKKTRAKLYIECRVRIEGRGEKATVAGIDAELDQEMDLEFAEIEAIEAEAERARLRGIADAVSAKKDVLQTKAAKLRKEMEYDIVVKQKMRDSRDQDGGALDE